MGLSIRHLRLVHEVAREGTLTGAAKRLFLTQSALSHQLIDLERQVGTPVFTRVGKRMVVTPVGRRILDAALSTLGTLEDLTEDLKRIREGSLGQLRITTRCHTAYHWLPQVLPDFRKRHPCIDFRIVPEAGERPLDALLAGEIDVALSYNVPPTPGVAAFPLFQDEQVLIVAPGHPYAEKPFVTAQDFADLDLLVYKIEPASSMIFERLLIPARVTPRSVTEVRITEGIVALVAAGVGAAAVTRWSVAPQIRAGLLKAVRITELGMQREWSALALDMVHEQRFAMDFIGLMERGPNWVLDQRDALSTVKAS